MRDRLRPKHYSIRTETQYVHWIRRFILFHDKHHPANMGAVEVEAFLTYLAVEGWVAASTQNQALSALLCLYREVLSIELPWLDNVVQAKTPQRLPVVLTRQEVNAVLDGISEVYGLMARLLYETGMRLVECVRLRVKDVDFARGEILAECSEGGIAETRMDKRSTRGRAEEWRKQALSGQPHRRTSTGAACRGLSKIPAASNRRRQCRKPSSQST